MSYDPQMEKEPGAAEAAGFTRDQVAAAFQVCRIIADTIRELGEVPSGHLYAQLCSFMSLETYNKTIEFLKTAKLISVNNHLIKWEGPR